MAKQTFTTGQVLTAAQMTDLQQTAMTGGAASTKTVSSVLVAADAGTRIAMNAAGSTTITVNTALFSAGDTVSIQNIGAGVCTVTAGTATVNTSGSLVLAQYQGGILYFTSASAAILFQFATPASGDIEGVTAGTGISGGGTSGTVTITNSMATAIDAKGDLVVGTGADTFSRLAVGTNGQVLTADSGEATGLKFATPASGGITSAAARVETDQDTTSTSYTDLTTAGPAVTLTTGTKALVIVGCQHYADTTDKYAYASYAISGATTSAASDDFSVNTRMINSNFNASAASVASVRTVTAGSNTFTMKYKTTTGANAHFYSRQIIVIDLGSQEKQWLSHQRKLT